LRTQARHGALEILPGRLYALGGTVLLDGGISWAPATGHDQPVLCYLVVDGKQATLVDTGLSVHQSDILIQLKSILEADSSFSVFLSRAEFDCIGNLGALMAGTEIKTIYTGGAHQPFDGFDEATTSASQWTNRHKLERYSAPGEAQKAGPLEVFTPALRTLATFWSFDEASKTLFTSDSFGHTDLPTSDARWIIDAGTPDPSSAHSVRDHVLAKFFWLRGARTRSIAEQMKKVFETRQVEIIAPAHGRVIRGHAQVQRHYQLLQEVLEDVGTN
jgi:flavorubredoxin